MTVLYIVLLFSMIGNIVCIFSIGTMTKYYKNVMELNEIDRSFMRGVIETDQRIIKSIDGVLTLFKNEETLISDIYSKLEELDKNDTSIIYTLNNIETKISVEDI